MYINPFLAGVLSTIFVELAGIIVVAVWWNNKKGN